MSVTSSGSNNADDAGGLLRRAMSAFDLLAGYHQTLGLAVSGGSDSLSLLVLGAEWAKARGRSVAAATVDHGLRPEALAEGWNRDRIMNEIVARGVPCYSGSCSEVYLEKAFDGTPWRPTERMPIAKELGETSLMFLTHPTLTQAEIDKTCAVIGEVMGLAAR